MRVTLNSTFIRNRRNCCNQMSQKAAKPLSTGIIAPRGKYLYLGVNCYFDINYVKHNLHQSGGKLLTLDLCTPQNYPRITRAPISESPKFLLGSLFPLF